jgi:hypothetical protein
MEKRYGIGPPTISVPRIKKAVGAKLSYEPPYIVDADYYAYIAALFVLLYLTLTYFCQPVKVRH